MRVAGIGQRDVQGRQGDMVLKSVYQKFWSDMLLVCLVCVSDFGDLLCIATAI